jgi:PAS domain S-box-containing protein
MTQGDLTAGGRQEVFEAVFADSPAAIAIVDRRGRYLHVNEAYARVSSRPIGSHRGLSFEEVLPAIAPQIRDAIEQAGRGEIAEFYVTLHAESDPATGERTWVGLAFPLRGAEPAAVATMMRDVTARTRAERDRQVALTQEQISRFEAERQRDFFRLILENAPMAISVAEGPEHRLVLINDFAVELVGLPREAMLDRTIAEIAPEAFALVRQVYDRVYATGEAVTIPERLVPLPDGRSIWAYTCYAPVPGPGGTPGGVMALALDISAMKRAQQTVESQKRILELMAEGRSLPNVLQAIANAIAVQSGAGARPSILLASSDGRRLHHGAAPHLPAAYLAAIDGLPVAEGAGSCGTAAFRRQRVIVADVAADPLWIGYRDLALAHGLRACWSMPILGTAGNLLGTFALYYGEAREPSAEEIELVELLAPTAALAIEWCRAEEERQRLLEAERRDRREASTPSWAGPGSCAPGRSTRNRWRARSRPSSATPAPSRSSSRTCSTCPASSPARCASTSARSS